MTTWNDTGDRQTAWGTPSTSSTSWSDMASGSGAWQTPPVYSETESNATPIGLLLVFTTGTATTTYPTTSDLVWSGMGDNQTAWRQ